METSHIILVPKKKHASKKKKKTKKKRKKEKERKKDYSPADLTSIAMRCLERLVIRQLYDDVKDALDPFQFAYKDKRGTDDAVNTLAHLVL